MMVMAFDTLRAAQRLREAGFDTKPAVIPPRPPAGSQTLATKQDLEERDGRPEAHVTSVDMRVFAELKAVESRLNARIDSVRAELKADLREMEQRMTLKLGAMIAAAAAFIALLDRLL